jgi:YesN/AraC family two-component response regulator
MPLEENMPVSGQRWFESMYKVMLIDDEEIIIEGLKKTVPWAEFGCELAGTADNGIDGQRMIREIMPDILITDIRMSGKSGLQMLRDLAGEFPEMQIIVLSGFREFEYAREAIRLGVLRFLLKPSKMDELREAISSACDRLNAIHEEEAGRILPDEEGDNATGFISANAIRYMKEHYAEKLSLNEVAEMNYISPWHLSKLLKKDTGQNFVDILNGIRVDSAKKLLKNPALKIYEVSEKVGFTDIAYFSRIFKKVAGVTPNDFRRTIPKGLP